MDQQTKELIEQILGEHAVTLFMKGTPSFPQCGFSARAVGILKELGVRFAGVDVLSNPAIREGIKEFAQWPTIPQLYVNGEFVGGSDIMLEMQDNGDLKRMFEGSGLVTDSE